MKKLVLTIAFLSSVSLFSYANLVKSEVTTENNIVTADDPNDPVYAYVVTDPDLPDRPFYFHTIACAGVYMSQPQHDGSYLSGRAWVEYDQVIICL